MSWFLFALAAFFVLGGAIGVVATRNVVWAALFLLVSLASAAGVYLLLYAEFLALVQVLIYGGAVTIVLLFAIMLTRSRDYPLISDNRQWPLAIVAAGGVFAVLMAAFMVNRVTTKQPGADDMGFTRHLAEPLFTQWALPFEIASLVLLVALVGAIVLGREDNGR